MIAKQIGAIVVAALQQDWRKVEEIAREVRITIDKDGEPVPWDLVAPPEAGAYKAAILQAIADEPELPGDMPDEMWKAIHNDRDAMIHAMRIAVKQTKSGIRERFLLNAFVSAEPKPRS